MAVDERPADTERFAHTGDLAAEVETLAKPLVEESKTPGIIVGVLLPDRSMQFFGYGVVDQGRTATPNGDTLFAAGSLSKGFLGALTAILVQEGQLSWTDTLGQFLPTDAPVSADARKITLLQLATHTSGLPRQPITYETFQGFVRYLFTGESFYAHLDESYVFGYLARFSAPKKPEPQYSNIGYGLLGHVIEKKTGQKLERLMQAKLLQPLGLTRTSYHPETLHAFANRAHGHSGDQPKFVARGKPVPDWRFTELMKGSAGLYSSAKDLLTFAAAHLYQDHPHVHAALADTLRIRVERLKEAAAVAWIADQLTPELRVTYQVGLVAGYTTYLGMDTDRRTAVVVLRNSFNWEDQIGHRLLARLSRAYPAIESLTLPVASTSSQE